MTPRQRRLTLVIGILAGVSIAGALALSAFRQNVTFFFDPTQVADGKVPAGEHFRLGGMVTQGSVHRSPGSLEVRFVVTDFKHDVPVTYTGVLPDLFREGTGVVAHGRLRGDGTFVADEVLAKHDEKYMPPEVARSLKRRHGESRAETAEAPAAGPAGPAGTAGAAGAPTSSTAPGQAGAQVTPPLSMAPGTPTASAANANSATPANPAATANPAAPAGSHTLAASPNHSPAGT